MPKVNPDAVYPKASHGRVQNTDDESESYNEIHFISMNVEGSKESEREKERWRRGELVRLDDKLIGRTIFLAILVACLAIAEFLYGRYLPAIKFFLIGAAIILVVVIIYYIIKQAKIKKESRKYKNGNGK